MTNMIIGILLLLTFFAFIVYVIKGGNLMLGFFFMAILWSIIGLVPLQTAIQKVFAEPALNYGPTIIYIAFGSWFGRVLVDSGIAQSISAKTEKVGRKSPLLAAILVVLVTAFIFVSAYGVGSVIAIGVILLPILFSLGLPKPVAVAAFTMAIGSSMYVNVVLFNQIKAFFPQVQFGGKYLQFGWTAMGIQLVAVIIFLLLNSKKIHANQVKTEMAEEVSTDPALPKINPVAYIIPVLPVFFNMVLHWDAVPALVLSTILAMLLTGKLKSYKGAVEFINNTIQQAISDIAGLVMFLMALVMFSSAAVMNTQRFQGIFAALIPSNTLVLAITIGVLAPLALFRGPLHVWGAGAATAAVLAATGMFSPYFLLPLLYIPSIMAVSGDITQSWNVWALEYTKVQAKEFYKYTIPVMWTVSIVNELVGWVFFGR
ncbi:gluconate:proton symporter [Periweissella cryptocerci]|uniref:Gluconate:proton symporter n=1 Tax=Periweissella cryptocerci TaxID=2506420 RepID=A0A4P6YR88_9LACO|nr:SLC13 family permease [Periweissella cryptocerci]QBO35134.1 gluconate:proton symporter [Periweissella cryptocerci]